MKSGRTNSLCIVAVSGGADSVYLLVQIMKGAARAVAAHYNHGVRGKESERDEAFVRKLCGEYGFPLVVGRPSTRRGCSSGGRGKKERRRGFEANARKERYRFLFERMKTSRAEKILVAHTADDQVETVLMRIMEGAGITGLKGIPRSTEDGIERPLLGIWREEILAYLQKRKIPYRIDKSNVDTRFERNWIRHVLVPLLEKRYGKSWKKRIYVLGERFRELDTFIERLARNWIEQNNIHHPRRNRSESPHPSGHGRKEIRIPRRAYASLPSLVRIRVMQILCFEHVGTAPNERLLDSMDRLIVSGGGSSRLNVGRGATLRCRYEEAILALPEPDEKTVEEDSRSGRRGQRIVQSGRTGKKTERQISKKKTVREPRLRMDGPGKYRWGGNGKQKGGGDQGFPLVFHWREQGRIAPGRIRRLAAGGRWAAFDGDTVSLPLSVRPLQAGDRIRPFGLEADKKVKEVLIDRKVPREERWGRPAVCDSNGVILWIPGILRSAHAPVTRQTGRVVVLRVGNEERLPSEDGLLSGSSMLN